MVLPHNCHMWIQSCTLRASIDVYPHAHLSQVMSGSSMGQLPLQILKRFVRVRHLANQGGIVLHAVSRSPREFRLLASSLNKRPPCCVSSCDATSFQASVFKGKCDQLTAETRNVYARPITRIPHEILCHFLSLSGTWSTLTETYAEVCRPNIAPAGT